jgi:outer membrane receptor protein involved in Fe transport
LYLSLGNADTEHGYLGFDLKYDFEELFEVYASGLYNHWTNTSLNSLLQKKRFEWKLGGEYNFNRKLSVNADYNIIIYQSAVLTSGMYRMPAVNSLGVGMDYKLLNYLSVNAHISNLFNRRYQDFYGYPAQKLNFLVGVSFRF